MKKNKKIVVRNINKNNPLFGFCLKHEVIERSAANSYFYLLKNKYPSFHYNILSIEKRGKTMINYSCRHCHSFAPNMNTIDAANFKGLCPSCFAKAFGEILVKQKNMDKDIIEKYINILLKYGAKIKTTYTRDKEEENTGFIELDNKQESNVKQTLSPEMKEEVKDIIDSYLRVNFDKLAKGIESFIKEKIDEKLNEKIKRLDCKINEVNSFNLDFWSVIIENNIASLIPKK